MAEADIRTTSPPLRPGGPQGLLHLVCTSNPFYIISAGLFLVGLRLSFGAADRALDTWSLMSGLAGYTLLLAVTACLLVRFGNVWDDVRTLLLLVVLLFLATSVTFDEVLVLDKERGQVCYVLGLLLAVAVSEGLLRGTRLKLPLGFRVPYYLVLALFFLYPLALRPLRDLDDSEPLMWGVFGFSAVAGLVFLTLLPAIRRGPDYVRANGSPWRWPWYPWSLFVILAVAVPGRAFFLCYSMHQVRVGTFDQVIFGPYFLVPFGLALAVLLLEIGRVARRREVLWIALAVPAGLVGLALVGHRPGLVYEVFREFFAARLGGDPLYLTLVASAAFYGYAALRRVPAATEALTLVLGGLAVVGPLTLTRGQLVAPQAAPLLAAATLQLLLGIWKRNSHRCLLGSLCLVIAAAFALPGGNDTAPLRLPLAFHLALVAVLGIGALLDDALARWLRVAGGALGLLACLAVLSDRVSLPDNFPPGAVGIYPLLMAAVLAGYARLLRHRPALVFAAVALAAWLAATGWQTYCLLRQIIAGLDYLVVSLVVFALAVLVSLAKAGVLVRRVVVRGRGVSPPRT